MHYLHSPVLFNLVLEKIVREINVLEEIELGQVKIGLLTYADDIALLGDNIEMIKSLGKKLMEVNDDKIEYLVVSQINSNYGLEQHIELEGHKFKKVSQFKYL